MVLMTSSVQLRTARSSPAEAVGGAAALLRIHRRSPNLGETLSIAAEYDELNQL